MSEKKPLEGIRVIEMSTFIAVPACARFFAEFGADVIKIEAKSGDAVRFNGVSEPAGRKIPVRILREYSRVNFRKIAAARHIQ